MNEIFNDSCLNVGQRLAPKSVNTIVTSPPYYGLRDYGVEGQIGLEQTPQEYVDKLVSVFRACREILRDDGTLWLNLGDSYCATKTGSLGNRITLGGGQDNQAAALSRPDKSRLPGLKSKDLIGIPWRVAFALQADGWYLRQDIIWHKPNPMPESVKDRCTKAHEYIFLLSKSPRYYFDSEAIQEDSVGGNKGVAASFKRENSKRGIADVCPASPMPTHRADREDVHYDGPKRNRRDVWTVATKPCREAHFATFPPDIIRPCILAGAPKHGIVLDPFMGAGTTAMVCKQEHRQYVGFELNPAYIEIAKKRITSVPDELDFKTDLPNMRS